MLRECTHSGLADRYGGDGLQVPPVVRRRGTFAPDLQDLSDRHPIRAVVKPLLTMTAHGATSLFGSADLGRRLDRERFWSAVLVACIMIVGAYAMDCFLFGTVQIASPQFFPIVVAVALAYRLPILGLQRLQDAGHSGWLMLGLLVPVAGWLLLMQRWSAPSVVGPSAVPSHPLLLRRPAVPTAGGSQAPPTGDLPVSRSRVGVFGSNVKG